ncbi:Pr6Pr family membrane protein [Psychromicrobium lacuslunae]|nr:Pr6Pr family membrane protein [Psychromicrobium lacuslunae]
MSPQHAMTPLLRVFGVLRLLVAAAILLAVLATFADTASRSAINPFNFFGYFTMQSNIIMMLVLVGAGLAALRGSKSSRLWMLIRASATTYMVIVGLVYNTLLIGLPGGVELAWANAILHIVVPVYVLLDWLCCPDRQPLAWRDLWFVLLYPALWCTVVLIRGATDGWVPYPFLNPATGYGSVFFFVALIGAGTIGIGALAWWRSRVGLGRKTG